MTFVPALLSLLYTGLEYICQSARRGGVLTRDDFYCHGIFCHKLHCYNAGASLGTITAAANMIGMSGMFSCFD